MRKRVWIVLAAVVVVASAALWFLLFFWPINNEVMFGRVQVGMTADEVSTVMGDHPGLVSNGQFMRLSSAGAFRSETFLRPAGSWTDGTYIVLSDTERDRGAWVLTKKTCKRKPSEFKVWLRKPLDR